MSLLTVCAFVSVVVSLLIVFTVCVLVCIGDIMGETETTPLSLMLSHFSDVRERARILSTDIWRERFQIYCISEWPTFDVGWPQEGTFHLPIILQVKTVIFRDEPDGHSDQVPYILIWQDMMENPPPWLKPFLPPKAGPTEILALQKAKKETNSMPEAPLHLVFQDSSPEDLILPPPYRAPPPPSAPPLEASGAAEGAPPLPDERVPVHRPAVGTRGGTHQMAPLPNAGPADSTALPLRSMGPPDETGKQLMLYWPFSTSDLYNWKTPNAKFSDNPRDLIGLLGPVLFTHQPTWEDCQQLLQVLFATEERERIQVEAQKSVLGEDRQPTQNPDLRNAAFPLSCPTWDYNSAEGKERPRVHRQTLMAGLQAAAHKPTNLAKVYDVRQGKDESPAAFLERVIEAFRQYTPMDPEAPETKAAIIMTFVNQAAPGIKKKLQRVERLGEKSLQDLVIVAERVYNNRQSPEEQQTKLSDRQTRNLAKILLATTMDNPQERRRHFKKLASGTACSTQEPRPLRL
uniref:uncharacterized protein LOC129522712 n=1 Tax=Nyctereutes procyonoides TaxID=34880 RepID=UPI002443CF82|nr:uncharacterized protein LOC129522712 [Nyctereutes procyonoides]